MARKYIFFQYFCNQLGDYLQKMKKMTGIILMLAGGLLFTLGLFKFKRINEIEPDILIDRSVENREVMEVQHEIHTTNSRLKITDKALQSVIEMAMADGILTQNEKDNLRKIATENNYDYNQIISAIELELKRDTIKAETEVIDQDKKKGTDFEKFVVEKFNQKFFKIKEWAGDKYVNGRYAETTLQPDLNIEFKIRDQKRSFAVECKYRSDFYQGGVVVASEDQLTRYKKFEDQENITVYLAIGVGGSATAPCSLYVVPLSSINSSFIKFDQLKKHYKNPEKDFFYDLEKEKLN